MSGGRKASVNEEELQRRRLAHGAALIRLLEDPLSVPSQCVRAYSVVLDEVLIDFALEVHREAHTLALHTAKAAPPPEAPADEAGHTYPHEGKGQLDMFGQAHGAVSNDLVTCASCGRKLAAGRFAPHLEKCLGKGRASGRVASRRIAGMGSEK